jgi:selenocysteine lyase/cysteine desulfurase
MPPIHLDNAATSFPKAPGVADEAARFLREDAGSAERAGHALSRAARAAVETARRSVAELIGSREASRVALSSGATEALNVALKGILREGDRVILGPDAHDSALRPLHSLARDRHLRVDEVPTDDLLRWDTDELARMLARRRTRLVVVSLASNVTGTVEPIPEIARMARGADALLLVDAAQALGRVPLDVERLGIDLLAWTGHKSLMGPTGAGGLYVRNGVAVRPLREGATGASSEREDHPETFPDALEAGTPDACALAPLAKAVAWVAAEGPRKLLARELVLARRLVRGLEEVRGIRISSAAQNAEDDEAERPWPRVAPVVSFTVPGVAPEDVAAALDAEWGIGVRSGLHSAPRAHRRIQALPLGTVRASPGPFSTEADVDAFARGVAALARAQR